MTTAPARRAADALDARLLLELVKDPRATIAGLAHRLSVARNTAHARVNRLEAQALHPIDHRIDPAALGYPLRAYILANLKQRRLDEVGEALAQVPEVLEVLGVAGPGDTLIQVVAQDADDLYRIAGRILAIPGVKRTRTFLVMRHMVPYRATPLLTRLRDAADRRRDPAR
ncbi:Lrp/AsnC family transcriptional regulator [Brevibacterium senegalense]|uniref:Lrp/AsnC family transcriptional regulator n=1 Tax=Brevibacterium senegalense TaxID=1033736 RepID=UPI00058E599E|nr:Lrp/AsnC family transcriptional regulator [Brevibacterium senegalense]